MEIFRKPKQTMIYLTDVECNALVEDLERAVKSPRGYTVLRAILKNLLNEKPLF